MKSPRFSLTRQSHGNAHSTLTARELVGFPTTAITKTLVLRANHMPCELFPRMAKKPGAPERDPIAELGAESSGRPPVAGVPEGGTALLRARRRSGNAFRKRPKRVRIHFLSLVWAQASLMRKKHKFSTCLFDDPEKRFRLI